MIKLDRANFLFSDIELLDEIALQLWAKSPPADRLSKTENVAKFIAPAIRWEIPMVTEYLKRKISQY